MAAASEAPPRMMRRLPQEEVDWILARVRMLNHPFFEALEDELEKLQAWVRAEYVSKGFVEVDHAFVGGRVRLEKKIMEYWEKHIGSLSESEDEDDGEGVSWRRRCSGRQRHGAPPTGRIEGCSGVQMRSRPR